MSQDVPMASHLLSSKVLGVSARKLAESMGPPLVPSLILYTLGLPLIVTLPLVVLGASFGAIIYDRTPPGQRPLRYSGALVRHYRGRTEYIWKPPAVADGDLAAGDAQDVWITHAPNVSNEAGNTCGPVADRAGPDSLQPDASSARDTASMTGGD